MLQLYLGTCSPTSTSHHQTSLLIATASPDFNFSLPIMYLSLRILLPGKGALLGPVIKDKTTNVSKCYRFSRVPYALPPTGKRRWRKPLPLPSNFSYGPENNPPTYNKPSISCPQSPLLVSPGSSSEDCLQCNIYIPLGNPPSGGWPVFFYIRRCHLHIDSKIYD